ncbi:MAG TPA: glycosyltransferase family 39 protein [Candidatus Acidoferrum sp.]
MTSQIPGETTATTAQRIGWAALIVVTLFICYFSHLGVIGFVGPDEPRYAWIARDMAESGDWVTPRLYGKPWFEKPPLLYWGGAIFFRLMPGQPEFAARLPSAISALLATLALAWLAWRIYGEECARWLLLLLPTSVGMIGFSHAAATDMPFAGMLIIAMVCAAAVLGLTRRVSGFVLTNPDVNNEDKPILPQTSWLALMLFGFFLGLAVLAKGPAAIILSGGAVFFWAVFTKRWRDALRLLHPTAIVSFCVTALPWYILCARRNPDFFRIFIIEHNFKRFLTPEFQHLQPVWFYAPILFIAFFPWAALLAIAILWGGRRLIRTPQVQSTTCFVLSWALFVVVFFSASKSKLPGYILPAVPAVALLLAHAISDSRLMPRKLSAGILLASGVMVVTSALLMRSYPDTLFRHLPVEPLAVSLLLLPLGVATVLAGLAPIVRASSWQSTGLLNISAVIIALTVVASAGIIRRYYLDAAVSARGVATLLRSEMPLPISPNNLRVFGIRRSDHYALNFYLHREIPSWEDQPVRDGYVLTAHKYCDSLRTEDSCNDSWGMRDFVSSGSSALLRITPKDSLHGLGGGREPK